MATQGAAAQAEAFLRVVHQNALDKDGHYDPDYEVEIRPIDQARKIRLSYMGFSTVQAAAARALHFDDLGLDGYYGVHLRRRGVTKGGDAAVAVFTSAFADIDCDKHGVTRELALEILHRCPWGPPAIIVGSGGGLHPIWPYRELLDAEVPTNVDLHQKVQRFIRWWLNDQLGAMAADDMSSRDRILRLPGTRNQKPERRLPDGTQPMATVLEDGGGGLVEPADVLQYQPEDVKWDVVVAQAQALDPSELPTQIPERLKRVIAAAGLHVKPKRLAGGQIHALILAHCPACKDVAGKGRCYITPSGRLKTMHAVHCPAAGAYTGGLGLSLNEWVHRYAPHAGGALKVSDPGELKRPDDDRLSVVVQELAVAGDEGAAGSWLEAAGFDADLRAEIDAAGLLYAPRTADPENLSRQARALQDEARDGEAFLPICDVAGQIRSGAWLTVDGGFRFLQHRSFGSLGDLEDGLALFGSLPAAIATGLQLRTVIVTETPHDYLAAVALVRLQQIDAEVVGVAKPSALRRLTTRLNRAWMNAGVMPPRVIVVRSVVPEAEALAASKRLDGRAGVHWFTPVAPVSAGRGFAGAIGHFGALPTARALLAAPVIHPVPVLVENSEQAIRDGLGQATKLALQKGPDGRLRLVIFVIEAGSGKTTLAAEWAADVAKGIVNVPVRGRRPASWPEGQEWPPAGQRRVGFALPNHKLAEEKEAQLRRRVPESSTAVLKGALNYCAFKANVAAMFPVVGRRGICGDLDSDQRCPEAASCPGAAEPQIDWGQVAFMAHQMAPNVKMDFCFIDESPGVVADPNPVDADMIGTLFASRILPRVKRWRTTNNPEAGEAALLLTHAIQPLADEHAAEVARGGKDPYPRFIRGDELLQLVKDTPGLASAMAFGYHADAAKPPAPFPNDLRAGSFQLDSFPSLRAFRAMQDLQAYLARLGGEMDEDTKLLVTPGVKPPPPPMVVIQLNPDRTWEIRRIGGLRIPDSPTMVLDATGEITLAEWQAAYPDRDVRIYRLRVQGAAPLRAIHLKTRSLRRRHLFDQAGGVTQKGAARVRTAALYAARATLRALAERGGGRASMGFLLYKPLFDLMTGAVAPQTPQEHRVAGLPAELAEMKIDLRLGYYGKHDRGTNDFEDVDTLIFLGDPIPNLGAVEIQCEWLGLDKDKVARDRAHATLIQSGFRARHTRRKSGSRVILVYVGEHAPELLGVEWESEPLKEHRRMSSESKIARAYAAVEFVAQEMGDVIGVKIVRWFEFSDENLGRNALDGIDDRTIFEAVRLYARHHDLVERGVATYSPQGGRPPSYFGPSEAAILQGLADVFGARDDDSRKNIEIVEEFGAPASENGSISSPENGTPGATSARKPLWNAVSTEKAPKCVCTRMTRAHVGGDPGARCEVCGGLDPPAAVGVASG